MIRWSASRPAAAGPLPTSIGSLLYHLSLRGQWNVETGLRHGRVEGMTTRRNVTRSVSFRDMLSENGSRRVGTPPGSSPGQAFDGAGPRFQADQPPRGRPGSP